MLRSLRGRLLLWYTAILASVIVVFGAMVCFVAWRSRLANVDSLLRAHADALVQALQPATAGTFDLTLLPDASALDGAVYHTIWTPSGTLIDRSDPDLTVPPPTTEGARVRDGRREWAVRADSGALVVTGQSLDGLRAEVWSLAGTMAAVGGVALALSLAGGWWLVGHALTPVGRISTTARAMVDGDFGARIPIDRVDTELEQVAHALNDAFARLHEALERQRRFTADASHELRTPLATISTELQWALARERSATEYRDTLSACRRASSRMQTMVERLLALARADAVAAGTLADADQRSMVRLDDLAHHVVRELQPLAANRGLDVQVDVSAVGVVGDPQRLRDAVTNVVANAILYNVSGGRVHVSLRQDATWAELAVVDTGVGISEADLPHVFEPFFRADQARSRDAGGAGLGLAVTHSIIRRHGGEIACHSVIGRGTTVILRLPGTTEQAATLTVSDAAPARPAIL